MQQYIQILRNITNEEFESVISQSDEDAVILVPKGTKYIEGLNLKQKAVYLETTDLYTQSEQRTKNLVLNFAHQKIGNKTPAQLLQNQKHSLWYYFRFRLYSQLTAAFFELSIFKYCLEKYLGHHIVFSNSELILGYANVNKIDNLIIHNSKKIKKSINKWNLVKFLLVFLWRSLSGLFHLGKLKKAKYAVISNAIDTQPVLNINTFNVEKGSHLSQYYQQYISNNKEFVNFNELYPLNIFSERGLDIGNHLLFREYPNQIYLEAVFFKALFRPKIWSETKSKINELKMSLDLLKNAKLDFDNDIVRSKVFAFKRLMFFTIFRKIVLEQFFRKQNLLAVGGTNEQDPKVRSVLESASNVGVGTYGIQHGIVHPFHMAYMFSEKDKEYEVFPHKTFLWGDFWKNILINHSIYSDNQLEVVGQVRTDIIPKLKSITKSGYVSDSDKEKTIIFYPSQPLHSREKLALDLFNYAKDKEDVVVYIKPHPMEFDCADFYNKLAIKLGVDNIEIINDDLFLMLSYSDIVVIYNSTVGAEAAYFMKPVIVLNYDNNDYNGFITEGFAYGVTNGQELDDKLNSIIDLKASLPEEKYHNFITKMTHKIDGKVAQRIEEGVKNLKL